MRRILTSLALKLIPEDGKLREFAKRVYRRYIFTEQKDIIHQVITEDEQSRLRDAVRIGFVGDLILLRDMIEAGKTEDGYNFQPMFEPMKDYFSECDLMTGVLEGPLSGDELSYTTANYEDGRVLECGYPDKFLDAIKRAGINFVTVANNHLFDKGKEGMERTIDQLEENSMPYVGYGKQNRTVITVKNLKIAILAFNFAFNCKKEDFFFESGNENLPHIIRPKNSKYFKRCLEIVKEDFDWAKSQNPDCIIVYPHVGDQFRHTPDNNQLHWFEIFKSLGADVILGCHSHATQPLRFEGDTLCLYCPGNFVNNYFPHDGDASAMVEAYLDKSTGKPFAASVIPLWAYGKRNELLSAMPMCKLAHSKNLSWHEWFRLRDAHKIVTNSMFGIPIPIDQSQKRFIIWNDNQYRRLPYENGKNKCQECKDGLPNIFERVSKVVFIGDSVTEGIKNGGYGWFEPMMAFMPDKEVAVYAKGSCTSKTLLELFGESIKEEIADLFCVAIGCNDIRYREVSKCAMSAAEYGGNIKKLVSLIKSKNPEAAVILIAPWQSDDVFDKYCYVDNDTKQKLYDAYTTVLEKIAEESKSIFVNPNHYIWKRIKAGLQSDYLINWIHPNASKGIELFSESFIHELSKQQL